METEADFETSIDLDARGGTLVAPVQVDAGDGATELIDSQTATSVTEVINFGDNDRLSLLDVGDRNGDGTVSLADVDFRVVDGNAEIEVDDGSGTLSRIVLRNVGGDALSIGDFNAIANLGAVRLGAAETGRAANVFLESGRGITVTDAVQVFGRGGAGSERVFVGDGARDVRVDANLERIDVATDFDAIDFAVTDAGLTLSAGGETRVTIPSLNQPTDLRFADGSASVSQTGATRFTLDGGERGSATLDGANTDVAGISLGEPTARAPEPAAGTAANVFLNPGASLAVFDPVRVFGRGDGREAIILGEDAAGIVSDANIERLDVPRGFAALDFAVTDAGLEIAEDGTTLVTLASLNQAAELRLADGNATLTQTGAQSFDLAGGESGTATIDPQGRDGDVTLGDATAETVAAVGTPGGATPMDDLG